MRRGENRRRPPEGIKLKSLRQSFSVAAQDIVVLNATILEKIIMLSPTRLMKKLMRQQRLRKFTL